MKITLLHGSAKDALQNKLIKIKQSYDKLSVQEINCKEISFEKAVVEFLTPNLFSKERLVVLENCPDNTDLSSLPEDNSLYLVVYSNLSFPQASNIISSAKKRNSLIINLNEENEKAIFPFLDGLAEKKTQSLKTVEELLNQKGGQYVLTFIYYLLRKMAGEAKGKASNLPDFVKRKIALQKQNFTKQILVELYRQSLLTDYKIKTGYAESETYFYLLINRFLA